jgi:hypothetical protein
MEEVRQIRELIVAVKALFGVSEPTTIDMVEDENGIQVVADVEDEIFILKEELDELSKGIVQQTIFLPNEYALSIQKGAALLDLLAMGKDDIFVDYARASFVKAEEKRKSLTEVGSQTRQEALTFEA